MEGRQLNTRQFVETAALYSALSSQSDRDTPPPTEEILGRGWSCIRGLQRSWMDSLRSGEPATRPDQPMLSSAGELPPGSGMPGQVRWSSQRDPGSHEAAPLAMTSDPAAETIENPPPRNMRRLSLSRARRVASSGITRPNRPPASDWTSPSPLTASFSAAAELFLTEIGIRVWAGSLIARSEEQSERVMLPIARNVLVCQAQVRQKALQCVAAGQDTEQEEKASLDRLRRIGERWTDQLLAPLIHRAGVAEAVFDLPRCLEFQSDCQLTRESPLAAPPWNLILVSLRTVFPTFPFAQPARSRLVSGIAETLLAMIPEDSFSESGLPAPRWLKAMRFQSRS